MKATLKQISTGPFRQESASVDRVSEREEICRSLYGIAAEVSLFDAASAQIIVAIARRIAGRKTD